MVLRGRHPADSSGMGIVLLGATAVVLVWYLMRRRKRLAREIRDEGVGATSGTTGAGG